MATSNITSPQGNSHSASGGRPQNLGEILVDVGVISKEQLSQAMAAAGGVERDLGKWLVDLGFTTEEKIMKGIGIKAKVPYFTSLEGLYTSESASIVSEELARRLQVVPLFKIDNVATVAMVNPLDVFTIDALTKTTSFRIDPVVCMRTTIFETINKLYGGWEGGTAALPAPSRPTEYIGAPSQPTEASPVVIEYSPSSVFQKPPSTSSPVLDPNFSKPRAPEPKKSDPSKPQSIKPLEDSDFNKIVQDLRNKFPERQGVDTFQKEVKKASEDMPIVQLVDAIFKQAVFKKASDIHIEPSTDHTEVRFRIDGVLRPAMMVPKEFENSLVARIKVIANLDITESRQPQDGRIMTEVSGRPVDLRISTLPIIHGEKVVIRILDKGANTFELAKLGFSAESEALFKDMLDRSAGIILVTGPTGSGKSTTLYTGLTVLNSPEVNIVTLEDPVEYQLPRINQVQVNAKVGLTFAKGLRSILRQDPDVIMLGEIRDQETAEIAIQSALTGHLVLSTLHTNDAPSAITRLINMKIEPFLISASVLMIIAQRLVRQLCVDCKEAYEPPPEVLQELIKDFGSPPTGPIFRPKSCEKCHQTGYRGRKGVYEIMRVTPEVRELAIKNAPVDLIRALVISQGMRTLFQEGVRQVFNGATSIEEMFRVCRLSD